MTFSEHFTNINLKKELHAEAIAEADVLGWAEDKGEVQIMDLLLQMKQKTAELELMKKPQLRKRVILQMEHLKGNHRKLFFTFFSVLLDRVFIRKFVS